MDAEFINKINKYMLLKTRKYDIEIELSLNSNLQEQEKENLSNELKRLTEKLNYYTKEEYELLETEYEKIILKEMQKHYEALSTQYEYDLLHNEGLIRDNDNPSIIRLTGRVTAVNENGPLFNISWFKCDVDAPNDFKNITTDEWMNIFDQTSGKTCKRDEDQFFVDFLKPLK